MATQQKSQIQFSRTGFTAFSTLNKQLQSELRKQLRRFLQGADQEMLTEAIFDEPSTFSLRFAPDKSVIFKQQSNGLVVLDILDMRLVQRYQQ